MRRGVLPGLRLGSRHAGSISAIALFAWVAASAGRADSLPRDRQVQVLRDAQQAYDQAMDLARDQPHQAAALFQQAAGGFEALVAAGLRNPALEYNLGNTYARLGDLGRAVLHYRRAQRLAPTDAALRANLDYVRSRVTPLIAPSGAARLIDRLLFWNRYTTQRFRLWLAGVGSVVGWLGLLAWLRVRRPLLGAVAGSMILLGLANAVSLGWQIRDEATRPMAVLVGGEQILRLGRGAGADPALDKPLGPGVELRILSMRGDWVEVQLPDDQTGWLPAAAVEQV